ncbi:MAG: hypothetical protein KDK45_23175 [Leptospiraceae bacterium]|nr:hypothetical protein [Leptospiraceae bacterium]
MKLYASWDYDLRTELEVFLSSPAPKWQFWKDRIINIEIGPNGHTATTKRGRIFWILRRKDGTDWLQVTNPKYKNEATVIPLYFLEANHLKKLFLEWSAYSLLNRFWL